MYADLRSVAERAEVLLAELTQLAQNGPRLRITHRFQLQGTLCRPGEEIWTISLICRELGIPLALSLALRQVVNYLAETRHVPQSASQIAAGMRRSAFYMRHGMNSGVPSRRKISRSAIKEYVKRIRRALALVFEQAGLQMDPNRVLVSKATVGNEVHYQLHARIEWVHLDENCSRDNS
jgi:hypothetical protein